jgi:hypothetical protein
MRPETIVLSCVVFCCFILFVSLLCRFNNTPPPFIMTTNKQGSASLVGNRRRRTRQNQTNQRRNQRRNGNGNPRSIISPHTSYAHFSAVTKHTAEAITNPFSDGAIGAVIPDHWSPPSIPAMDRISLDIDPSILANVYATATVPVTMDLSGLFFAFVPRSLATGWVGISNDTGLAIIDLFPLLDDLESPDGSYPVAQQYCIFMALLGIPSDNVLGGIGLYAINTFGNTYKKGYNLIGFSRTAALEESGSGARIVGAGIKLFSDEAPIETGGTVYGGWMSLSDIYLAGQGGGSFDSPPRLTRSVSPHRLTTAPGGYRNMSEEKTTPVHPRRSRRPRKSFRDVKTPTGSDLQDYLLYRHTYRGLDGVTVRYSPLQSSEQEVFQPIFETALYADPAQAGLMYDVSGQMSIGAHDLIGTSDYVPAAVWRFNSKDDLYSIRFEARVHLQVEPDGDCPFMSATVVPDPHFGDLQIILENKDAFPVVTKGQSFKSFNEGVRQAFQTLGKGLGLATKVKMLFGQ